MPNEQKIILGKNPAIGTSIEDVADLGDINFPVANNIQIAVSSGAVADASGSTGAKTVKISGLDDEFKQKTKTVSMNGRTKVTVSEALGAVAFSGAGLNDLTASGIQTGSAEEIVVEIDGVGSGTGGVDTFKWSNDGGSTWEATTVDITGLAQTLENGIKITFAATTGHFLGNSWAFDVPAAYDLADFDNFLGSGLNDATFSGAYTHTTDLKYEFKITTADATDKFKWRVENGTWSSEVTMTGSTQTIEKGIVVTFAATTGHTLGDVWTLNCKRQEAFSATVFTGTSPNDMTASGSYIAATTNVYVVEVDGVGSGTLGVDTFKWSNDGGATWEAGTVDMTGSAQSLEEGISITFAAATGHKLAARWTFTATKCRWSRINSVEVMTVGTGGKNAGVIYVYDNDDTITSGVPDTATTIYAGVNVGENRSHSSILSLAKNENLEIKKIVANISDVAAHFAEVKLWVRLFGGVFVPVAIFGTDNGGSQVEFSTPIIVPEKADVKCTGITDASTGVATMMIATLNA